MQKKNRIKHTKKLWLAGALLAAGLLCGCTRKEELLFLADEAVSGETGEAYSADSGGTEPVLQEEAAAAEKTPVSVEDTREESSLLYVHVCGAVEIPGVYELPAGSRVYEAVQAAGGFTADAEQNYVNQAQILTDGVKLVIPTREEAAAAEDGEETGTGDAMQEKREAALQLGIVGGGEPSDGEEAKRTDAKVNINTASQQELCGIPGVGATRAAAIIAYRESHGGFAKPEDIMKVNGIKEGMYEKIKDSIRTN
ncbi:MAG: helix-hairpin-helix domain-containing protein [Lachnospiraceae bacterium]|nr:helix-hairpin-helix domain-containing protein [Lachnospiraceae bacterium]MDE7177905.1 helix-hairpin-helix domain-containing protein [Lachnospiraceae bacterium]